MIHYFLEQNSLGYVIDRTAGKGLKNKYKGTQRRWVGLMVESSDLILIVDDKNIFKGPTFSTERTH